MHWIVVKAKTYGIVRVEDVGRGGVVDDDDPLKFATEPTEVFDVVAAVEDARFAEESRAEDAPLVQQIRNRIRILGQRGRKQDALVELAHLAQKLVHVRPLQHVHLMNGAVNLHRDDKVRITDGLNK